MTKRCLLLVDGDEKSLRVLEVSLKKAGFNILTANTGIEALQKAADYSPDLVISDTEMEEMDGYAFCKEFKQNPNWADVPFVFLTKESSIENKIKGLELGVDDYLTKPIYIKEILTRVRILLQKRERSNLELKKEHNTRFAGQLNDMGVVDLIQTIEVSRKTGIIYFRQDEKRQATIFFKDGKVIDAETGHLQGEEAVYRILTWNDGEFEALFRPIRRKDTIEMSSQALLMEGMRRLDDWGRLQEQLPPLDKKFEIVYDELWERLSELPDNLNAVLRLFDTRKTLNEVIDGSSMGDLEVVEIISKLYFEGIIAEVGKTPKPTAEIEAQLGNDQSDNTQPGNDQPDNDQPGNGHESGDEQEPDPITAVAYDPTTDLDESDEEGDTPMGSDLDAAAAVAVADSDTGGIISEADTLRDVDVSSGGGNDSTTTDILDKAITAATPIDKSHPGTTTLSGAPVAAVRLVKKVSKTLPFAVVEIRRQKPAEEESPEPDQDAVKLSEEAPAERRDDGTSIEEEDEVASDSPDSAEDSNSTTHGSGDSESGDSEDESDKGDSEDESDKGDSEDESNNGDSE
ncbi:MAG: response regulator, partial [Kofleriaceae bacterium]|nr:response regulator [Kofleriaceae bacterium]